MKAATWFGAVMVLLGSSVGAGTVVPSGSFTTGGTVTFDVTASYAGATGPCRVYVRSDNGSGSWGTWAAILTSPTATYQHSASWTVGTTIRKGYELRLQSTDAVLDSAEVTIGPTTRPGSVAIALMAQPNQTTKKWTHSLTNSGLLAETYRLKVDFATGQDVVQEVTVLPGATLNLNVEDTRDFTVSVEKYGPLVDGIGMGWTAQSGLPAVQSGSQPGSWTASAPTATAGNGNVWTDANKGALGSMPDLAVTPQTRSTDYSDTTKAVQTSDANAQARHAELASLLVAADRRSTERANVELQTLGAGIERLRQAVVNEGEANRAAITNLDGHLTGEGSQTTVPVDLDEGDLTSGQNRFAGWWSPPTIGKTAPQVALPLSLASDLLADATLDLGDNRTAAWVTSVRGLLLAMITGGFLMASFRLVGRAGGV